MRFRFAEEALAEYIAAGQYYNEKVPGLGDAFAVEIEDAVQKIHATPLTWRVIEDDVRRFLIEGFPYGIYYSVEHDCVLIWAVKHLRRDPDYWQERRAGR